MTLCLTIERLGAKGDGVAAGPDGAIHIPFALPGEEVEIERMPEKPSERAKLIAVKHPSPQRIKPICGLFTLCGGCAIQHLEDGAYREWKRALVETSLKRNGLDTEIAPLVDGHGDGRRRVTFHARYIDGRVQVGFMEARSHSLVEIPACPVLVPEAAAAPSVAQRLAEALVHARKPLDFVITCTQSGYDVDIRGHGALSANGRATITRLADTLDLARVSLHGDVVVERRQPIVSMGRSLVVPAPGAFLQATALGETLLAQAVLDATAGRKRIADLFSGCGPFTLRLAERADVHAVETEAAMLQALDRAMRHTERLHRVTMERRDLFKRPLLVPELNEFDAVVIDPPRAGAEAQTRFLAQSSVPTVVSVSCDATTFARDAAVLVAGGYTFERAQPIDQFKYSPHVEIVGVFRKPESKRKRR